MQCVGNRKGRCLAGKDIIMMHALASQQTCEAVGRVVGSRSSFAFILRCGFALRLAYCVLPECQLAPCDLRFAICALRFGHSGDPLSSVVGLVASTGVPSLRMTHRRTGEATVWLAWIPSASISTRPT